MRGIEVAELVLLTVALLLAVALILQYFLHRGCRGISNKPRSCNTESELPLSRPGTAAATTTTTTNTKQSCRILLLKMLCSRRRHSRVEPASPAPAVEVEAEDVARWFGLMISRALYTIQEEGEEEERPSHPDTPFYTPPVSPHRLAAHSP